MNKSINTGACDEYCGTHGCTNGHNCPARNVPTLREVVEAELGFKPVKTAKVGKRYHAAPASAPSHWRKTLKLWAAVAMTFIGIFIIGGVAAGIIERVWP